MVIRKFYKFISPARKLFLKKIEFHLYINLRLNSDHLLFLAKNNFKSLIWRLSKSSVDC